MKRARPPVIKTIAQCRLSGSRGGKVAAFGRDRARRKTVPVTLPPIGTCALACTKGGAA